MFWGQEGLRMPIPYTREDRMQCIHPGSCTCSRRFEKILCLYICQTYRLHESRNWCLWEHHKWLRIEVVLQLTVKAENTERVLFSFFVFWFFSFLFLTSGILQNHCQVIHWPLRCQKFQDFHVVIFNNSCNIQ